MKRLHDHSMFHGRTQSCGYSLLELAAVISIIAVILGLSMSAGTMQLRMAEYRGTRENLETIQTALDLYKSKHGRYPCPASLIIANTDSTYGTEVNTCTPIDTCAGLNCTASVAIGAVPFRAIGVGADIALDKWDNRIFYAIDRAHAAASGPGGGALRIVDANNNAVTASPVAGGAIYVLVSAGANQRGAFPESGRDINDVVANPEFNSRRCNNPAPIRLDSENCDLNDEIFRDMPKNQGAVAANVYDDEILWKAQEWSSLATENTPRASSTPKGVVPAAQNQPQYAAQARIATWWLSSCAVNRSQEAYCWGNNDWGRVGDGTVGNRNTSTNGTPNDMKDATKVSGGFVDWVSISTHLYTTCGVRANGMGYCWGSQGNLGSGSPANLGTPGAVGNGEDNGEYLVPQLVSQDNTPTLVTATITDWVHISTSTASCGLRGNGTIYCWGNGGDGMLGNGTSSGSVNLPVPIDGPTGPGDRFNDWANVEVWNHACAVRTNGLGYCWGTSNANGQLGIGSTATRTRPALVAGGITDWKKINVGPTHSCGTTQSGRGFCWGRNAEGQLGDATVTGKTSPVEVSGDHGDWSLIDAGNQFSCGLRNGKAYCWGSTASDRLGLTGGGLPASYSTPQEVSGNISDFAYLNAASDHTCALRSNDSIWCWGNGSSRELGDGTTGGSNTPVNASTYTP